MKSNKKEEWEHKKEKSSEGRAESIEGGSKVKSTKTERKSKVKQKKVIGSHSSIGIS